jgi:hypothetical protein
MNDAVLAERLEPARATRLDILIFCGAFGLGLVAYFTLHGLGARQSIQTAAIVAVLIGYAVAVAKVPRLRVRLDQAGDNAYYLGLLFTLISMATALYEFSVAAGSGTEQIISNFGIALASTIAGIFLRVFLHQMRVDPADVESMTRIELAEATKRVKASIDTVTGDLGRFHDEVRQRMVDVIITVTDDYRKAMMAFTSQVTGATADLLTGTENAQRDVIIRTGAVSEKLETTAESARVAMERLRAVEPPPTRLNTRLDKVCASLEALSGPVESLTAAFQQTGEASAGAIAKIADAAADLVSLARETRDQQAATLQTIHDAARDFRTALGHAGESLQQDKEILRQLEVQARNSADQTARAHSAATETLRNLTAATKEITAAVNSSGKAPPRA